MKNKGCVNQGCMGCLWICFYLIIFVIAISGLGFFGLSIGVIGATLAYTSPTYREWLRKQQGFQLRLSKLPGMASSSPTTLAFSTLAYTVPLSLISWIFLLGSFGETGTTVTAAVMGFMGLFLLFGWFIKGWGIKSAELQQQGESVKEVQETQYFNRIRQLEEIRQLDPVAFERFVGSLFEKMGYQVQTTALSGDEGIDLILRKDGKLAIVQCKRYENSVGQPIVRDLYGAMVHSKASEAYLVTTGTVTLPAQQWVVGKPIHLVDGNTLIEWIDTLREKEISQPTNAFTDETDDSEVRQKGIIGYFKKNLIASIVILFALILPLCCCLVGTWVSPIVITPTPTPTPLTPTPTRFPPTATPVPSATTKPITTSTPTATRTRLPTNTPRPTQTPMQVSTLKPTLMPTSTRMPATLAPQPTSTRMPATLAPQPTSPPVAACEITAWVNDENPAQRQHVYVYGKLICNDQPAVGATMHVVWNYKSTTETCDGVTDAAGIAVCERSIGGASKGYKVRLDVSITYEGKTYRTTTGFTPQ